MQEAGVRFSDMDAVTYSIIFPEYNQLRDSMSLVGSQKESMLSQWQDVLLEEVLGFREQVLMLLMLLRYT